MQTDIIQVLLLCGTFGIALTLLAHLTVHLKLARTARMTRSHGAERVVDTPLPAISILKPLKGIDDNLYANLVSLIRQDYPRFEILLGLDDADDPALSLARQLQRDYPRAPLRLVVRRNRAGLNPKVNNLASLLDASRYETLLISDSNVIVSRDYLRATAAELEDPGVGLVSNLIVGDGEQTLGALLENFQLNTFIAAGVCLGDWLGHPVVVGKSMLMRRADLERVGGLQRVRDVLAEDYVLGKLFHDAGMRVVLSAHPVCTVNQQWRVRRTLSRHARWAKLRRWLQPGPFLLEPLSYAGLWFSLAGALCLATGDTMHLQIALAGMLFKATLDALMFGLMRRTRPSWLMWPLSVLRDLLMTAVWAEACVSRSVDWRGNRLRIGKGTVLSEAYGSSLVREPLSASTAGSLK